MDVGRHPRIHLLAYSELEKVDGSAGNFTATVRKKARYVNESKCTGCGGCSEKCPTVVTDDYNLGLGKTKAIYRYFAQGIPSTYTIDARYCRQLQGKKCGVCAKVCQAGAIDYEQKDQVLEIPVGAVVVATGYELFDARRISEYGFGRFPNVVSALQFERFLSASGPTHGHVYRPSDLALMASLEELEKNHQKAQRGLENYEKKFKQSTDAFYPLYESGELKGDDYDKWAAQAKAFRALTRELEETKTKVGAVHGAHRLAFIQCVGSRDIRFNPYCSGFCCMHSIKEAIIAREHDPQAEVFIFGMDIRAVGKGFEEYRNRGATEAKIQYVRSRVAEITEDGDHAPVLWYEDTAERRVKSLTVDMVILATACEPSASVKSLSGILGIAVNDFGFFRTDPAQPLDSSREGIFVCGCAQGPMDIPESVAQSSSAAARAAQVLSDLSSVHLAS